MRGSRDCRESRLARAPITLRRELDRSNSQDEFSNIDAIARGEGRLDAEPSAIQKRPIRAPKIAEDIAISPTLDSRMVFRDAISIEENIGGVSAPDQQRITLEGACATLPR